MVLVGVALRALVDFSQAYPPGTDAGYYPLQVRTLLVSGHLMYHDLPLVFWLEAGPAWLLARWGWPLDDAILAASRAVNCVAAPFAAVAVMALGRHWSGGRRQALSGCAAAALIATTSAPALLLIGFHKSSLGLVWFACALWACRSAMHDSRGWRWTLLCLVVALSALTHVGGFAVTAVAAALAPAVWRWLTRTEQRRGGLWLAAAALGALAALAALLASVDPGRARTLIEAPVRLFGVDPFRGSFFLDRTGWLTAAFAVMVLAFGARRLYRDRASLPPADAAVVAAVLATIAVLVCPKNPAYMGRLVLMVPVPAAFVMAFLSARRAGRNAPAAAGYVLLGLALVVGSTSWAIVPRPVISEAAARELRAFRPLLPDAERTLVVAPHGLEWFAGFLLHTPVRMSPYGPLQRADLPADVFTRYRRVLLLRYRSPAPPTAAGSGLFLRSVNAGDAFEAFDVSAAGGR